MSGYYFLTGATGLLGNYLLRDLLRADRQVAVLVRSTRKLSARQRVENLLAKWDAESGEPLPRPVILEGDITQPDLGLDAVDLRWVSEYCTAIIHNAASLTFQATSPQGEPYRSNVVGTQNVLDFARQAGIREFHHVSTAYVAGLRSGKVLESEVDVGQELGNDYEISKLAAEKLVRAADFIDPPTFYRPGIIVGDSQTGFTTTYHGFYAALQLSHMLVQTLERDHPVARDERGRKCASAVRLNLDGTETKHLVPVDWVSAAMVHVLLHPEHHGQTYHLTPRQPVTTKLIKEVLEESIGFYGTQLCGADYQPSNKDDAEALFHEHIRIYNSYWRMDPEFSYDNIQRAAPHLPCPDVDFDMLVRLSKKVIEEEFPTPSKKPPEFEFDADQVVQSWMDAATPTEGQRLLGLDVRGPGGGQWQLVINKGQLAAVETGLHSERLCVCRTDVSTFARLVQGRQSWSTALHDGSAQLIGNGLPPQEYTAILDQLLGVAVS